MKKYLAMAVVAAVFGMSAPVYAQSTAHKVEHGVKKGAKKAGQGVKKGAKKVGNETAELATKGKAKVTDKQSDAYLGPDGQTIYIDGTRYYWINNKGGRVFVLKSQLRPKS